MLNIVTNNHPRDVLHWWDLTAKEQKEFDYIGDDDDRRDEATFFRYRDSVYDLGEFCRISRRASGNDPHPCTMKVDDDSPLLKWQGYLSDSYFSMVLVRYVDDMESVVVGLGLS